MRYLVALLITLSGCLSASGPGEPAPSPGPADELPDSFAWNAAGCNAAILALLPDYATVQSWLPAGFTPGDPQDFLGLTVPVGRALVVVGTIQCPEQLNPGVEDYAHATVAIFIKNPPGQMPDAHHFYDVSHSAQGWLWREFDRQAWPAHDFPITLDFPAADVPPVNEVRAAYIEASYADDGGEGTIEVVTGAPFRSTDQEDWNLWFWRVTPQWLAGLNLQFSRVAVLGAAACQFDADTMPAQVTGFENCAGQTDPPVGAVYGDIEIQARLASFVVDW